MRKIIFILFCIFLTLPAHSQSWEALGTSLGWQVRAVYWDTTDNYLYATGAFYTQTSDGRKLKGIARWDGIKWDSVGNGVSGGTNTFAFARYNNDLYVGGVFDSVGYLKAKGIGIWKGTHWDTMAVQPFKNNWGSHAVYTMAIINNELYFGGIFDTVNGVPCKSMAKWNGTAITPIGMPSNMYGDAYVFAICEFNGEIYVGGNFSTNLVPNDTIQDIFKYDGTYWKSVGGGMKGASTFISSMAVYNNELYVAGYFNRASGNTGNSIQKWDGLTWSDVGGGMDANGAIAELLVHNNKLYAMGGFQQAGGIPADQVATWDGTNWCSFGSVFDNGISAGCFYKDTLVVGGGFWTIDGDTMNYIAKWAGGNYTDDCGNTTEIEQLNINNETLNLYPNPAQSQLTIEFELFETKRITIEIKNILGQSVKIIDSRAFSNGKNNTSTTLSMTIDVSEFLSGVYFVRLQSETQSVSKKFVKQ